MTSTEFGKNAELRVYHWLRNRGFRVHLCGAWAPFDLRTESGTTIDVKVSHPRKRKGRVTWDFFLEGHGQARSEQCVDFYLFRFETGGALLELGMTKALHLLVPGFELRKRKSFSASFTTLFKEYGARLDVTDEIAFSDARKTPEQAARAILLSRRHSPSRAKFQKAHPPAEATVAELAEQVRWERGTEESRDRLLRTVLERNAREAEQAKGATA